MINKIQKSLKKIYGNSDEIFEKIKDLMKKYSEIPEIKEKRLKEKISNKDSVLITYGDTIISENEKPLVTLKKFLEKYIKDSISTIHILPFYPYSSDDGFSVIDFRKVNPELGTWEDIQNLSKKYRIMVDLVLNHVSVKSDYFKDFLEGKETDFFLSFDSPIDVSKVFRPRTHPLLTKFHTKNGEKFVWTTFSEDQVDLNFSNPRVLIEMIDIMLFYFSKGIEMIRLDAVGFIWKEIGTRCFHHEKAHEIVRLLRMIIEHVAPYAVLITETNVPYDENISYFGDGDEADMIYQFSYPPLVAHAFITENTHYLKEVLIKNEKLDKKNLFFNFLASHDGIGLLSAKNALPKEEYDKLINAAKKNNGLISYKTSKEGENEPYELNINYLDLLERDMNKFVAAHGLIIFSKGVPGIYIHSLLGSLNDVKGAEKSGINRRINREKIILTKLEEELKFGRRNNIFNSILRLLQQKKRNLDFDPFVHEKIIDEKEEEICFIRGKTKVKINVKEGSISISDSL